MAALSSLTLLPSSRTGRDTPHREFMMNGLNPRPRFACDAVVADHRHGDSAMNSEHSGPKAGLVKDDDRLCRLDGNKNPPSHRNRNEGRRKENRYESLAHDLGRALALWPSDVNLASRAGRHLILQRLATALRQQRQHAAQGHSPIMHDCWRYDGPRWLSRMATCIGHHGKRPGAGAILPLPTLNPPWRASTLAPRPKPHLLGEL